MTNENIKNFFEDSEITLQEKDINILLLFSYLKGIFITSSIFFFLLISTTKNYTFYITLFFSTIFYIYFYFKLKLKKEEMLI